MAQQVAAATQPEEDFEEIFETVKEYFRDLPDEEDVPALQPYIRRATPDAGRWCWSGGADSQSSGDSSTAEAAVWPSRSPRRHSPTKT